jgi:hypothetical protein
MAEKLKNMNVNPGDPITSELLQAMAENINLINAMAGSTTGTPGAPGAPGASQVIDSGRPSVPCNTAGTGELTIPFKKTFSARPNITCTVWQPSGENFLTHKYMPVVTSASATEFTVRMMPVGATRNGKVYVQWIAVDAPQTQGYQRSGGGGNPSLIE